MILFKVKGCNITFQDLRGDEGWKDLLSYNEHISGRGISCRTPQITFESIILLIINWACKGGEDNIGHNPVNELIRKVHVYHDILDSRSRNKVKSFL